MQFEPQQIVTETKTQLQIIDVMLKAGNSLDSNHVYSV
jgi:hypothetical protein